MGALVVMQQQRYRPFAAPVTTATYTVPSSIAYDGSVDVSADLNSWIATVPDGSIIDFAISGANYRIAGSVVGSPGPLLWDRHNLILRGHGWTTLTLVGSATGGYNNSFTLQGSSHITIDGFHTVGNATWLTIAGENQHCVSMLGWSNRGACSYVEITNCTGGMTNGDFVYIEGSNDSNVFPATSYVWVHHNAFDYCTRNAVSWINSDQTWVENNSFDHVAYHMFDIEPNFAAESNTNVIVRRNACGSYAHRSGLIGAFFSSTQPGNIAAVMSNITVADNTVVGIAANGYDGTPLALDTKFWNGGNQRYSDITFTGNSTTRSRDGYAVIYFQNTDGVVCTGNRQPYTGSTAIVAGNCTNTTLTPNDLTP